jgi:hypothetical protein
MVKRKGVCAVCGVEFELSTGSFDLRIVEDDLDGLRKKWTITVQDCADEAPEDGFFKYVA